MDVTALRWSIWEGSIPCKIELDSSESCVRADVLPYFTKLPRLSYIPLYISQIFQFFEPWLDTKVASVDNAWLEFEGVPLKWHWPIGVLYDLFIGRDPSDTREEDNEEYRLPWSLILHFENFPTKHLMRAGSSQTFYDAWNNCLKESSSVRNGSAKTVMSLSKAESTKLWEGLVEHDFDKFWGVNDKLISDTNGPMRNFPIRVYIPSTPRVVQLPVSQFLDSKEPQTIGTALHSLIPELFKSKRAALVARPVVHGVVVAMNTPLAELGQLAVYPDGFLHVTLAMMS
ncbi:autophagy protein Apg5-domain-containing protein [Sphaerosporella brunnea]|uniref:Autophagy protein 5 n=1 Tax=Sphaerosporella brunnea TaxID=1250544 RepID=A0A5J5EX57_9PEZI|nr:autophagy protein Apg5-domain-containing protein [Sphaerosporella brunnea]